MKFLSLFLSVILVALSLVQAASVVPRNNTGYDDGFFAEFIAALERNGLATLADTYKSIVKTAEGKQVIDFLKNNGELTLLAPEDDAFDSEYSDLSADVLLYNTLWGSIDKGFEITDLVRRRAHSQTRSVTKTGFKPKKSKSSKPREINKGSGSLDGYQVQVIDQFFTPENWKRWYKERLIFIDRAVGKAKVVRRFTFKKIIVLIIDTVLTLPGKVSELLCKPLIKTAPNGFTKFEAGLKKAGLLDLVDKRDAITIFAPTDDEFCDIDDFSKDELSSFLKNHFFFGKIVYSPQFPSTCNATAQSGKQLDFFFENDIHYVTCGKTKAVVLRRDVISANGVVHIIDRPLKCDWK